MRRRSASGRGSNIGSVVYRLSSLKYVFPIFVSAQTRIVISIVNSRTGDFGMTTQQHTESFLAGYRKERMLLFALHCQIILVMIITLGDM